MLRSSPASGPPKLPLPPDPPNSSRPARPAPPPPAPTPAPAPAPAAPADAPTAVPEIDHELVERVTRELSVAETPSQGEIQLAMLHNLLQQLAASPEPELLYHPEGQPKLSREEAIEGLNELVRGLRQVKDGLTEEWIEFHREWDALPELKEEEKKLVYSKQNDGKIKYQHEWREGGAIAEKRQADRRLANMERALVRRQLRKLAEKLDRAHFEDEYRMKVREMLDKMNDRKVDEAERRVFRLAIGLDEIEKPQRRGRKKREEQIPTTRRTETLLKALIEAQVILARVERTKGRRVRDHHTEGEKLLRDLMNLLDRFARLPEAPQLCAKRDDDKKLSAILARDRLEGVAGEVLDWRKELTQQWKEFGEEFKTKPFNDPAREEAYKAMNETDADTVKKAFRRARKILDPQGFDDFYITTTKDLLKRFTREPELDQDLREQFRLLVGLRKFPIPGKKEEIEVGQQSTIDLLKILITARRIEKKLPKPRLKKVATALAGGGRRSHGARKSHKKYHESREVGRGEVRRGEFGRVSERKARMYELSE